MADPVLDIRGLTVDVGGLPYVRDVSLRVGPGQTLGLLGPNGAGKTTVLRTLYSATKAAQGEIVFKGRPRASWPRSEWSRLVGALVQGDGLLAGLTPADIVDIGLRPLGLDPQERQARLAAALAFVGLADKRGQSAENLSGGERQRCYFAQLLARAPELYVLDEPTNHLDLHYQLKLLDEVKRRDKAAIACFHDLAMANRYCDVIAVMEEGRIVAHGPPDQVLTRERIAGSYRVAAELRDAALHIEGPIPDEPGA